MPEWFTALFAEAANVDPVIYCLSQGIGVLAIICSLISFQAKV